MFYENAEKIMKQDVNRMRDEFYHARKKLWDMYWKDNDGSDILRPNGFDGYPEEIYNLFLSLVDHDGRVMDLGCGQWTDASPSFDDV